MFEVDRLIRIIRTSEKRSIRSRYNRVSRSKSFFLSLYIYSRYLAKESISNRLCEKIFSFIPLKMFSPSRFFLF